mgnify:CR=1 FL=1
MGMNTAENLITLTQNVVNLCKKKDVTFLRLSINAFKGDKMFLINGKIWGNIIYQCVGYHLLNNEI